jgi:hypothetical protein
VQPIAPVVSVKEIDDFLFDSEFVHIDAEDLKDIDAKYKNK